MMPQTTADDRRRGAVADALASSGLKAEIVAELPYKDRYRVLLGTKRLELDVFYDGKSRITGVEPAGATGATQLVLTSVRAIESLPPELLRPRFRDRLGSPAAIVDLHTAALDEAGIEVCDIRFAQFQITYDLEDAFAGPAQPALQMTVAYDRRGVVTWVRAQDHDLGHRAVRAIGATGCAQFSPLPSEGSAPQ